MFSPCSGEYRGAGYKRWVTEAIAIRKQHTTMNRDEGQINLSHVYDDLLVASKSGNTVAKQPKISAYSTVLRKKTACFETSTIGMLKPGLDMINHSMLF